jgi:hypothetical protein
MTTASLFSSRPGGNGQPRATSFPNPDCIDLAERFGRRYRVEYEPAYAAQYGPRAKVNDPWLKIMLCRAGHICPWGGSMLAAVTDKAGPIARKLAALPRTTLWQNGSDGATVLFDVADFAEVANVLHPRRNRRLSDAQRQRCAEHLAKVRPQPLPQQRGKGRISTATTPFDMAAVPAGSAIFAPCGAYLER